MEMSFEKLDCRGIQNIAHTWLNPGKIDICRATDFFRNGLLRKRPATTTRLFAKYTRVYTSMELTLLLGIAAAARFNEILFYSTISAYND